ncbi:hypothetical protein TNCV_4746581 [Trichonephila clavipes]|nr:hypothetical protein TNCV_4746581 [Trichonephila clavipes]
MPLSRMLNSTFAMPNIIDSHDMGLRTVLQSRRPKRERDRERGEINESQDCLGNLHCITLSHQTHHLTILPIEQDGMNVVTGLPNRFIRTPENESRTWSTVTSIKKT